MKILLQIAAALLLALTSTNAQTVSGSLTTSSPLASAENGAGQVYYFKAYTFQVTTPGTYTFSSSSSFDSYAYLYLSDSFYFQYPQTYHYILEQDDENNSTSNFGFQHTFTPGKYTLVVTTFSSYQTGTYSFTASGPASLTFTNAVLVPGIPPTPLPVKLLNFIAKNDGKNSAELQWSTVFESNFSHFEVEKSADGKTYGSLGHVAASAGNNITGKHTYSFNDPAMNEGVNIYRLKMKDNNGTFAYSHTVNLSGRALQLQTTLYPNPTSGLINLLMSSADIGNLQVTITDLSGRIVLCQQFKLEAGRNELALDLSTLPAGAYALMWNTGSETGFLKLTKK